MKASKKVRREKRKRHIRKNLHGSAAIPRVFVFKSNSYLYAGAADDDAHKVIASAMSDKGMDNAAKMGEELGKKLVKAKYEKIVFDRSGYKYHGNVKAIADGIRKAGLKF
ncbi:MAG: 50S ribosomal protein L18 [Candidatus Dojkabacteria bacterium]|nr:MAG: 50S ribosomal protein L18 [Candidatus Dojkabacteria bacterium]